MDGHQTIDILAYLATRTLQVIRFDDFCFSMRIGDMIYNSEGGLLFETTDS